MIENAKVGVTFYEPPKDLERFFTTFYRTQLTGADTHPVRDSLHPEWAGLRIFDGSLPHCRIGDAPAVSDADCLITGPSSLPLEFTARNTGMWGIGLLPLGWATFVGQPADHYANTINNGRKAAPFQHFSILADSLRKVGESESTQHEVITDFFRSGAPRFGKEDPRIQAIHSTLIEPELPQVSEMTQRLGINQRTLERLCRKHFGFSPKLLLRRQRFMRSLADFLLDPSLGWIGAIDSLYFDQSHFVKDCKEFLGMPPSEYAAMDHPVIVEFIRERARVHGSAVQTLDEPEV